MVNFAALSTQQTPPIPVPMRFLATVPLFVGLTGLLLATTDPLQLESRWNMPVLAITHSWVLGMMLMAMLGALQQVIPVLVGVPLVQPGRVSFWSHLLLVAGILILVFAFLSADPRLFLPAALLLLGGVLPVGLTAFHALLRSPSSHVTGLGMKLALLALLVTVGLGGWLALGQGGLVTLRREWTDLHLGWGLLGWSVLLLSAVAWQVVPMFQITPRYPPLLMRLFAPALFGSLLLWMAGRWWLALPWLELVGELSITTALLVFALTTLWLQSRRRRRIADATLDLWRVSMGSLILAVLLWWLGRAGVAVPGLLLGELLAVGFVGSAILGMLYKIVPFLVWLHLANRVQEQGRLPKGIPNMKQVIPPGRSRLLFRVYLLCLLFLLAIPFRPGWFALPAGLMLILVASMLGWHLLAAMRLYRRHLAGIGKPD